MVIPVLCVSLIHKELNTWAAHCGGTCKWFYRAFAKTDSSSDLEVRLANLILCVKVNVFRRVRYITKSDYVLYHVCLSVRLPEWKNSVKFYEISYFKSFRKSVEKIQVPVKSD